MYDPLPVVEKYLLKTVFGVRFTNILIIDEDSFIMRIAQPSLSWSPGCEKQLFKNNQVYLVINGR